MFEFWIMSHITSFLAFLVYQDCDAKIKIHLFSIEYSSLTRSMLLDPMMEELKLIVVEKYEFKNIAVVDNLYGIFSRPQIGSEEKHTLTAQCWSCGKSFPRNE